MAIQFVAVKCPECNAEQGGNGQGIWTFFVLYDTLQAVSEETGQEMHRKKLLHLLFLMCVMLVELVISSFIYSLEGDPLYWDSYRAALVSNTICSCALLSIQFMLLEKKTLESELWLAN